MNALLSQQRVGRTQKYMVPGDPTALARARHGRGKTWDTQKDVKRNTGIFLQSQHQGDFYLGPLSFDVVFFLSPPLKTKRPNNTYHHFKPDLDNLIKFILDVATGILYKDDSVISCISAMKKYSDLPRTEIIITQMSNGK
jgi:Holliday junction resolvase RusA-like endonuclease